MSLSFLWQISLWWLFFMSIKYLSVCYLGPNNHYGIDRISVCSGFSMYRLHYVYLHKININYIYKLYICKKIEGDKYSWGLISSLLLVFKSNFKNTFCYLFTSSWDYIYLGDLNVIYFQWFFLKYSILNRVFYPLTSIIQIYCNINYISFKACIWKQFVARSQIRTYCGFWCT